MTGPGDAPMPMDREAVLRWRQAERLRLLAARAALPAEDRRRHTEAIVTHLDRVLGQIVGQTAGRTVDRTPGDLRGCTVAVYWPIRGEPGLRPWMERLHAGGVCCALPVVVQRHAPLRFVRWQPGARMVAGHWNIPVPADAEAVEPDVVVAPVVGFDAAGFRLGYGGGYYDRTLAAMLRLPRRVGVGFAHAAMASIHPLPHDVPMELVVTELGPTVSPCGPPGTQPPAPAS